MDQHERIADSSVLFSAFKLLQYKNLRKAGRHCAGTALRDFFWLQYKERLTPSWSSKKIPVYQVDHPLDERIPFLPEQVNTYLDFVYFWIRATGFLAERYGTLMQDDLADFIHTMGDLYSFAAEVYRQGLSTTRRPRYLKKLRFIIIHTFDPHLMCIPSLHVMVVCRCYTKFRDIARRHGLEQELAPYIDELRQGAIAITESILFVKQHSVNCIPAAYYALTCFDQALFSPKEAESFTRSLFTTNPQLPAADAEAIRNHILELYRSFCTAGNIDSPLGTSPDLQIQSHTSTDGATDKAATPEWTAPLIKFLHTKPLADGTRR